MKFFYLLTFISLLAFPAKSQTSRNLPQDAPARVIRFYPNPAVSQITFDLEQVPEKNYSFQVYNFVGKKVLDIPAVSQKTIVNVTDFYRGVYIFQLRDKNGKLIDSGKFQVSH